MEQRVLSDEFQDLEGALLAPGTETGSGQLKDSLELGEPAPLPEPLDPRAMACRLPGSALWYARAVDQGPHPDTRSAAMKSPVHALYYALEVDREPRDDTRRAACADPESALNYADLVDRAPREDTRRAACRSPQYAVEYAIHVDGKPLPETREAARTHVQAWTRYQEFERRLSSADG